MTKKKRFLVQEKDFHKNEVKNNIYINLFDYENKLVFPFYVSYQKFVWFVDSVDLLLLVDDGKSVMCTSKILTDLYFTKQKIKTKNGFVEVVYSVLVVKVYW